MQNLSIRKYGWQQLIQVYMYGYTSQLAGAPLSVIDAIRTRRVKISKRARFTHRLTCIGHGLTSAMAVPVGHTARKWQNRPRKICKSFRFHTNKKRNARQDTTIGVGERGGNSRYWCLFWIRTCFLLLHHATTLPSRLHVAVALSSFGQFNSPPVPLMARLTGNKGIGPPGMNYEIQTICQTKIAYWAVNSLARMPRVVQPQYRIHFW